MNAHAHDHAQQELELNRVVCRISETVLAFCRDRVGRSFHMSELQEHVHDHLGGAPDSPSRILRDLRKRGRVQYQVLNRHASLYQIVSVR